MTTTAGRLHQPLSPEEVQTERRARRFWVGIILGLLGLQIATGVISVMLALGDPTVAIIPNYHQNAVNWDSTRRARQLTEQLGLSVEANAVIAPEDKTKRVLMVTIKDSQGNLLTDANLHAKIFHHADGRTVHNLTLKQTAAGNYVALTGLTQPGLWQLDLQIEGEHGIAAISREMHVD